MLMLMLMLMLLLMLMLMQMQMQMQMLLLMLTHATPHPLISQRPTAAPSATALTQPIPPHTRLPPTTRHHRHRPINPRAQAAAETAAALQDEKQRSDRAETRIQVLLLDVHWAHGVSPLS
jgi:hypothetical protein